MHAFGPRSRPRREAPGVYRRRRATAATAVILVVFAAVRLAGGGGGDSDGGGGEEVATGASVASTTTTTDAPLPDCADGDEPVRQDPSEAWDTVIVDRRRALDDGFGPRDLVSIDEAGFPDRDETARRLTVADLQAMGQAAAANGTPFGVVAAYRSYPTQVGLLGRRVAELGEAEGRSRVARPGHSEHQLGTAIDVGPPGANDVTQAWAATPEGQWIAGNAHRFGWVLSYPSGAETETCYDYEPWHLRYLGRARAAELVESGLTLREFLYRVEASSTATTVPAAATPIAP